MGKLFIVPTPIGNLGDMTPRAIEILKTVSLILAEDTRTSAHLLKHFDISTPMTSFHKFNEHETLENVIRKIEEGSDIALVSDAGTPGISDPGFLLARECRIRNIEIETLPGPTAFIPALVNSGLPCDRFCFEGFLPVKKGRATALVNLASETRTSVIYESPLRLLKTLQQLADVCGSERPASVSREISKLHESTVRATLGELITYFSSNPPRGEIVIILGGKDNRVDKTHHNKFKHSESTL